ncbi:hypothetical protein [Conservatibacter flavescens]|uniref:Uncharacterized protein n=1 Tax=Conservatibacter flavescens TaxID=28161 RepID=A0A2M8S0W2_9PAST|nr:hypothetical protein [Conservatibacter flavescens]PJG84793.1 hypothetical protein CVP05_09655 [Conservatibacter flavescens]
MITAFDATHLHSDVVLLKFADATGCFDLQGVPTSEVWQPNGYMVAWFLYTLNGDNQAKQVFVGQNAEIKKNANWQNVQMKGLN